MKINIHKLTRSLLLVLFVLYFAQGIGYEIGSMFSQVSLLLIIAISLIYFTKTLLIKSNKTKFYWAWTILISLNILGFVFTMEFSILYVDMFKNVLVCLLTFYPFYYFSQKNILLGKHLIAFFIVILSISILQFYSSQNILRGLQNREDVVNNIAYSFVFLLPYVFLFKKNRILGWVFFGIIIYFVLMANKRGAIFSTFIGMIFFVYFQFKTIERNKRISGVVMVLLLLSAISYFAYNTFINNEYLVGRMTALSEGDSSNRDLIFKNVINAWLDSDSLFNLFFGYGFAGSLKLSGTGNYAHNDWLELLSNFGLSGVIVYACLFLAGIKASFDENLKDDERILLLTIISMWFITSLFSMWYTSIFTALQVILIAYLIGYKHFNERTSATF